ncbi:hypothetical protein KA005_46560, partial [bacterium]|nr:hypothetical protein [bacterium]
WAVAGDDRGAPPGWRAVAGNLDKTDYEVRNISQVVVEDLVQRYHYAKGGSNTGVFRHGLFHKGDSLNCLGIAWWIPPTKSCAEASYEGDWRKVLVLSRFVILPSVPKNAASFLLSKSIRLIQVSGNWECLLTYADTYMDHIGTIYKATNWKYLGKTKPQPVWIIPENGRMIAKKAGGHTRTKDEMLKLGYKLAGFFPKHKYRMIIRNPKRQKEHLREIRQRAEEPVLRRLAASVGKQGVLFA